MVAQVLFGHRQRLQGGDPHARLKLDNSVDERKTHGGGGGGCGGRKASTLRIGPATRS
jgi:hypothetical protein